MLDSRYGKILVITYAVASVATYIFSYSCGTETCGLFIVAPILPWAWILTDELGLSFPWAVYPILVLLNASIFYVIGAAAEWLYDVATTKKEERLFDADTSPLL